MNLFPVGYDLEISTEGSEGAIKRVGYKPSVRFDGVDLVRDGQHKTVPATGVEAWEWWCIKCLSTERYMSLVYLTDYGIETNEAFHAETKELAESILYREITEALQADPYGRTDYIERVSFDWQSDTAVAVNVIVVGIEDVTLDLTVQLGGGGDNEL